MDYDYEIIEINNSTVLVRYFEDNTVITVRKFLILLRNQEDFRQVVNESVLATPWNGIFYEGVPMNEANMMMPYFWIARKTNFPKSLQADPSAFQQHFEKTKKKIVNFKSPSGTILIAPAPGKDYKYHLHLKEFVEKADPKLVHQFWKTIGDQVQKIFKSKRKEIWWLKTHGHAVDYLHFRIQNNLRLFVTKELGDLISAYDLYKEVTTI